MKIDFITAHDPRDIKTWSGLNYFIMQALESQGAAINIITQLSAKPNFGLKWRWHFYTQLKKNYQYERSHCYARQFGEQINRQLSPDADFVLSTSTPALAYIESRKPVMLYTDATFDNLAEYYGHFSHLATSSKRQGDQVERLAYHKCAELFFSSEWAAASAINFYKAPSAKVHVIPFGANLMTVASTEFVVQRIAGRPASHVRLLWTGVDFVRKGGPFALAVAEELRKAGVNASIQFIGVDSRQTGALPPYAEALGFIDKHLPENQDKMSRLFADAHFFLFPTTMDCSPVVLSEACAFGLPCFTTDISGIPTIVKDGENGFRFSQEATPEDYALKMLEILTEPGAYQTLALKSRQVYDDRLNWKTSAKKVLTIAQKFKAGLPVV